MIVSDQRDANHPAVGRPLDRCPVCRYPLRGLPPAHRCPECGFRYDALTRVWRARGFGRFAGWVTVGCVVGLGACVLGFVRGNPTALAGVLLAAVAVFCSLMVLGNVLLFRRRPFVALSPAGLVVREHWFTVRTVPWARLGRIEKDRDVGAGKLAVHDTDGKLLTYLGSWFTPAEVHDFMAAEQEFRQRHGSEESAVKSES